jgi:hypothetical protein
MSQAPAAAIRPEQVTLPAGHLLTRLPVVGLVLAIAGGALGFSLRAANPRAFAYAWMNAFLFGLTLALGGLFFILIQHATQAGWSVAVRRIAEAVAGSMPVFAFLFIPVLLGMGDLFPWARPEAATEPLMKWKAPYLNTQFFLVRAVVYFVVWSALAIFYARASRSQDQGGAGTAPSLSMRRFAPPAILLLAITQTFAAIDWAMSLSPKWYSTVFGVYFFAGSFVGFFGLLALLAIPLERGPLHGILTIEHLHDVGKHLFAFTCFWAYIGFCQFFLIWYGNIPEETAFYQARLHGGWGNVSVFLAVGHFIIPFFYLMGRTVKRKPFLLAIGAAWILLMHLLDIAWIVLPSSHPEGLRIGLLELACYLAVGGIFLAAIGWNLRRQALVPTGDPRLRESLAFEIL